MLAPTSGDASVAGYSIITGMAEIRQLFGVCPQHVVLWLELTVLEHLRIYARLRGVPALMVEARAMEMLQDVGLTEKSVTRAGSLSGGQKRKLSLCLSLISKPRVAFLDEPTSGMDPSSRRSTWNLIQSVREGRVTILTTHFMDEADILGDRIAILAEGTLQCCGSSLFLKTRFGAGYRITCARHPEYVPALQAATGAAASGEGSSDGGSAVTVVQRHVPEAELLTNAGTELSMRVPTAAAPRFPELFTELDEKLQDLGLEHYGVSMVTLEEVFLRIASGHLQKEEEGQAEETRVDVVEAVPSATSGLELHAAPERARAGEASVVMRSFCALYMKRARYARRDLRALCCSVLVPVVLLVLGLSLLNRAGSPEFSPMNLDMSQFGHHPNMPCHTEPGSLMASGMSQLCGFHLEPEPAPEDLTYGQVFGQTYEGGMPVGRYDDGIVPTDPNVTLSFLRLLFNQSAGMSRSEVRYGAVSSGEHEDIGTTVTLEYNSSAPHVVPTLLNVVSNSLNQAVHGEVGCNDVQVATHPLPVEKSTLRGEVTNVGVNLCSTFVVIMAFSFIPASNVAYVVRERQLQHNSKHQQLISGVSLSSYWLANLAWDLCVYVLPAGLSILFLWAYNLEAFVNSGALWAVFLTFVGYGLSITPFSYLISFLFQKHTTAQAVSLVLNFFSGLLLVIVSYVLNLFEATQATDKELLRFFRLFPSFSLGHSMLQICSNSLRASLGLEEDVDYVGWDVAGTDILYLFATAPFYMIAVVFVDYLLHSTVAALGRHFDPQVPTQVAEEMDADVAAESLRVQSSDSFTDVVRILALRWTTSVSDCRVASASVS